MIDVEAFTKRVIYNVAKTYATQLKPREGYSKLNPLIALTITDFILFENTEIAWTECANLTSQVLDALSCRKAVES